MSTAWGVAARPSAPLATPAAPITKGPHKGPTPPFPPNPTHAVHHRFVEFIAKPATTRVVGLANISADGLAAGGRGSWYNGVGGELDHVSSATVGFLE